MKIIDLSVAIENDVPADPPGLGPRITYTNHAEGAAEMLRFFPRAWTSRTSRAARDGRSSS
ncbi:hypothetical protein [Pseudoxanthomonas sp. SORGH_AS_0997]|uniref:hypothetical protein n=1 Tax=Pseudoxanthomonas sp. SORGH_AS_0997 TaxID=3041776 RepID=UPI002862420E|nr:hypothetical protein [Pseudoxanthomonas sp. SORGH_AS_0997]MDR6140074.1 hypothetical protein [Pseudoxanthomonas sp. SORGH_AS_0997]